MPEQPTPGQVAYAAFTRVFDPQQVQWHTWPDVPRKMQLAWEAAAQAAITHWWQAHEAVICGPDEEEETP